MSAPSIQALANDPEVKRGLARLIERQRSELPVRVPAEPIRRSGPARSLLSPGLQKLVDETRAATALIPQIAPRRGRPAHHNYPANRASRIAYGRSLRMHIRCLKQSSESLARKARLIEARVNALAGEIARLP